MVSRTVVACLLLVVAALFLCAEGKVVHSKVKGHQFVYLGKFCYGYGNGTLNYTITTNSNTTNMQVLFIDDQDGNWTAVYKHGLTCDQIVAKAKQPITVTSGAPMVVLFEDYKRPHFWYVSVLNCGQDISLDYDLTFLQEQPSKWVRQFSYDEQGLEGLYLFWFIVFLLGGVVHGYTVWSFMQTGSYHPIVRLFTIAIALEGLSIFSLFIHYAVYSSNGEGAPGLKGIGDLLDISAQVVFILLVVLIAKGWCISKTNIDDRLVVLIGLAVLVVSYLAMFIWVNVGLDPASTLYVYETAPGIIIIVVRSIAMLWFIYSMRNTFMEENNAAKRKFYLWFGVAFLFWFISLPFITAVAAGLSPWVRQKTVMSMYVTFNGLFLFAMGFLLWPTRASEYFQISVKGLGSIPYEAI